MSAPTTTMAAASNTIPNTQDPSQPFLSINLQNILKLTPTNYLSWKLQIEAILVGYDLLQFIDGSLPCPSSKTIVDSEEIINPQYNYWVRQDKLLFGALIGTLSSTLVPLVSQTTSSKELFDTLHKTYATPSRGHIKQLKDQFNNIIKSDRSITEFMQAIKACADNLASLGKKMDHEDIIDQVLFGLDKDYDTIKESVNARDTPLSFEDFMKNSSTKNSLLNKFAMNPPVPQLLFPFKHNHDQNTFLLIALHHMA